MSGTMISPDDALPQRISQQRLSARRRVQDRFQQEIRRRYATCTWFLTSFVIASKFIMGALWILAWVVTVCTFSVECDQKLRAYMPTSCFVHWLIACISKAFRGRRSLPVIVLKLIPQSALITWGSCMLLSSQTCSVDNPLLYYTMRFYIQMQIMFFPLSIITFALGSPRITRRLTATGPEANPGCERAVHELPHVSADSPELQDEDDGEVMECAICQEQFGGSRVIVRTPCSHHFDEECLALWCRSHRDCPLCRSPISNVSA